MLTRCGARLASSRLVLHLWAFKMELLDLDFICLFIFSFIHLLNYIFFYVLSNIAHAYFVPVEDASAQLRFRILTSVNGCLKKEKEKEGKKAYLLDGPFPLPVSLHPDIIHFD